MPDTITASEAPAQDQRNPDCPPWCQTGDHAQGELRHSRWDEVACSLHPLEWPNVEGARSKVEDGTREWHQQNHSMGAELQLPPFASEPFIIVQGHTADDGSPKPQETRLTLAEAAELARILTELVATGRAG